MFQYPAGHSSDFDNEDESAENQYAGGFSTPQGIPQISIVTLTDTPGLIQEAGFSTPQGIPQISISEEEFYQ